MTERSETERAELVDKITQAEVAQIFGDMMPAEAAVLLMNPGDRTTDQLREALRRLVAQDQKPVAWLHTHSEFGRDLQFTELTQADRNNGWTEKPLYLSPPPAAGCNEATLQPMLKSGKIMLLCQSCSDNYPEGCGHFDLDTLREAPDGSWVCEGCWDEANDETWWRDLPRIGLLRHNAPPDTGAGELACTTGLIERDIAAQSALARIRKVRDGYANQAKFADVEQASYFREFIRRLDEAVSPKEGTQQLVPDHGGADAGVKAQIATLAQRFWTIHPRELQDKGMTREEFYIREMTSLVAALSKPAPVAANASAEARLREALDAISHAEGMLSKHIEEFHDFDYLPGDEPSEVAQLRGIQHHLLGSLIDEKGEPLSAHPHASDCDKQGER